jgi:uncharacterized membrane protein
MAPLYVLLAATAALLVLGALTGRSPATSWPTALRLGLAAMFVVTGASHFVGLRADLIAIVPPALPAPGLLVTVTGVLELAGAAGLLWRRTAAWSAAGLAALLVALFPANVYAAMADVPLAGEPPTALPLRTLLQVVFVAAALAVWATSRRRGAVPSRPRTATDGRSRARGRQARTVRSFLEAGGDDGRQ